ncbi:MAG: SCO family protein [Deltaproteobacteria bacterium]|nr:SCO family protein [Deltaproteobacteria bacterium]
MRSALPLFILLASQAAPALAAPAVGVDERLGEVADIADVVLVDEEGQPVRLGELMDRPVALSLVFYRCTGICSPLLQDLSKAADNAGLDVGEAYRLVTVSFDPGDTPELARLKRDATLRRMKKTAPEPEEWRFLTGDQASIDRITQAVGFNYTRTEDGQGFNHPGVVVFLSPEGKICRYLHGQQFNPLDVRMAVEDAAVGRPRPLMRKIQQLCFAYDPVGRAYVLRTNRIILAVTMLFAFGFGIYLVTRKRRDGERREDGDARPGPRLAVPAPHPPLANGD